MIPIKIQTQPTETTCGPTSLHAIYDYYNDPITLEQVIEEVVYLESGGTLAVMLACHALKRGYSASIYTYNLKVFDPTWFSGKKIDLREKLQQQLKYKDNPVLRHATDSYLEFLNLGGELRFVDLTSNLLKKYFRQNIPILTGLNATYLYKCAREYTTLMDEIVSDDVRGFPLGHFVVLCGYDRQNKHIIVADPYRENSISHNYYYSVRVGRLVNSIMLGIVTYDANFLIIRPQSG